MSATVVPAWRQNRTRAGKRLRAIREAAGLNQIQLAAASGLTHEAISRLETGTRAPYAETVRKLARALQVDPERFVARDKTTGLTLLTVGRGRLPAGRAAGSGADLAAQGAARGDEGLRASGGCRRWSVAELARSGRLRGRSGRLDPRYRG